VARLFWRSQRTNIPRNCFPGPSRRSGCRELHLSRTLWQTGCVLSHQRPVWLTILSATTINPWRALHSTPAHIPDIALPGSIGVSHTQSFPYSVFTLVRQRRPTARIIHLNDIKVQGRAEGIQGILDTYLWRPNRVQDGSVKNSTPWSARCPTPSYPGHPWLRVTACPTVLRPHPPCSFPSAPLQSEKWAFLCEWPWNRCAAGRELVHKPPSAVLARPSSTNQFAAFISVYPPHPSS
jgi:hypothetical protein